jgi:hypothetical protein
LIFLFNNTHDLPFLITNTKCPNQVFYICLVDLQTICAKYGLETWFSPNDDIRKCFLDMRHGSTKYVFWNVNNTKWRKWCELFHRSYLITLMAYLCSQWTWNVQMKYCSDWVFSILLVVTWLGVLWRVDRPLCNSGVAIWYFGA